MDSANNKKIPPFFIKAKNIIKSYIFRVLKKNSSAKIIKKQAEFDKKLVISLSKSKIPSPSQLRYIKKLLSKKELWTIRICFLFILISLSFLGARFYFSHIQTVPLGGGIYTEGLIGSPKYINPLYSSLSDVDSDIGNLIFSSLLKRDKNGDLANDLAKSYEIAENGRVYIFKIRNDVVWHNDILLKADDIIFTFNTIKDGKYKSPLASGFGGVEIEKIDNETIKFNLNEPYAAFLDMLTFGIMPEESWYQISPQSAPLAELNLKPIGSGPYKFKSLSKDKNGQIKSYSLTVNSNYYSPRPYLKDIVFKFFPSLKEEYQALNDNSIDGLSYLTKNSDEENQLPKNNFNFYKVNFSEEVGIFFNQKNNAPLGDKKVRSALKTAINKNEILSQALNGQGKIADSPILESSFAYLGDNKYKYSQEEAKKLLDSAGWTVKSIDDNALAKAERDKNSSDPKINKEAEIILTVGKGNWRTKENSFFIIKISTVDSEENLKVADIIKKHWENIGVKTEVEAIPGSDIQDQTIKTRDYEVLLYGQIFGPDPDCYVFWHSSRIGENGLNLSGYSNKEVDKLLEDTRIILDPNLRKEKYIKFQEIIYDDAPAVYLYSPYYTYGQNKKVKGFDVKIIYNPQDRFNNINEWYVKTGKKLIW